MSRLKTNWEDLDGELDEVLDAGDNVVALGRYVGMFKATGKRLRAQFAHVWTLRKRGVSMSTPRNSPTS